ncbi:hypothetical protein NP233_g9311 [Leucocoprinus birnbaumii]|uniref:Uncharacterized protein n=1 Tax=Leucocoprinus birnbaumii TaxID=56174 RepID=A0AAD5YMC0_9AGAR|nr:hypothetical protein NP233_g9311 [Leucocoprinus birnbaumii]
MSEAPPPPPATAPSPFVHEENGLFVGIAFESIFYGITVLLYFLTMRNLWPRAKKRESQASWRLMSALTLQQIALLIAVLSNIQFCVLAFVYHRDVPGGPVAYQIMNSNVAPAYASIASYTVCNWFQDVILLYRFLVRSLCLSFPLGFLSGHAGLLNVGNNLPVSTIYFSLSVGLNVILTLMIIGRILYRARMATIDNSKLPKRYTSVSAMLVESAALSAVTGVILIITLHTNVASSIAVEALYGVMTVLSPVLIAYRVSTGEAWTKNTTTWQSTVRPALNVSSGVGSRTALGSGSEDIVLKSRDGGLDTKAGHAYRKDYEPSEEV